MPHAEAEEQHPHNTLNDLNAKEWLASARLGASLGSQRTF